MSDEPVRLTRQELFDLVWSTPMTKLAARFGISNVALSKTCHRHNVPTPGRGYWAQLAAGKRPTRPKLPKSAANDEPIIFRRVATDSGSTPKVEPPAILVPEQLRNPHPAVEWLAAAFKNAKADKHGRLAVGHSWSPEASVTKACVPRALTILDAFVKAMEARGHRIEAKPRGDGGQSEILAFVYDDDFTIEIEEKLGRKPHELMKEEKQRKERWSWTKFPKYDYFPGGELALRINRTHYKYTGRKSVSDTSLRRIEDLLGHLVLATEQAAELGTREKREAKRREEEWRAAERRRLRGERLQWYGGWLAKELQRYARDWDNAKRLAAFIGAYQEALPKEKRTNRDNAWLAAIQAYARRLDPLASVAELSRDLEPSDEELADLVEKYAPSNKRQMPYQP